MADQFPLLDNLPATGSAVSPDQGGTGVSPTTPQPGADASEYGLLDSLSVVDPQQAAQYEAEQTSTLGATAEGLGKGILPGGAITLAGIERAGTAIGIPNLTPEAQAQRELGHPGAEGAAEAVGLLLPTALTMGANLGVKAGTVAAEGAFNVGAKALEKYSQSGVLSAVGQAGAKALGLGVEGAGAISRIGSKAVAGAIENSLFTAGHVGAEIINGQNPSQAIQNAIPAFGLSAVLGGVVGGVVGTVPELWQIAKASDLGNTLNTVTNKLGGQEGGVVPTSVDKAIDTLGIKVAPEVRAGMSSDPHIQEMALNLEQGVTGAAKDFQKATQDFNNNASASIAETFGVTPEQMANIPEPSKYEVGKNIGDTLAGEYQSKLDPTSKEFEELKSKYKDAPLTPDTVIKGNDYFTNPSAAPTADVTVPGTASVISDNLAKLADKEGWVGGDPDINRELVRVLKALPQKETLGQLTDLISQVGNNTKSTAPFGLETPLSRAGSRIKKVLREGEDALAIQHLGAEAPQLVDRFRAAQAAYKAQAALRDGLADRLGNVGGVSNFAKGIRSMSQTDGEGILRKLSGSKNANLLAFLKENFPQTAQALKDYHVNELMRTAVAKAKPGESFNVKALQKAVKNMSPEMQDFALPQGLQNKLEGMGILQEQMELRNVNRNWSNTGRTIATMLKSGMGSTMATVAALTGHGWAATAATFLEHLGVGVPNAARLAFLKFLGSTKPIDSIAFKGMTDFINSSLKGENLVTNATKEFFKAGSKVIPDSLIPTDQSRARLQKSLIHIDNPQNMMNVGGNLGHYMPEHQVAAAQLAATTKNYFDSLMPKTVPMNPFDSAPPADRAQMASYNRQLDIAQQPLLILQHAKDGTLLPQDVATIQTLYPALHSSIVQKLNNEMIELKSEGKTIPYAQRVSMSLLMGSTPLDSTMNSKNMQAIIQSSAVQQMQRQAGPMKQKPATASTMKTIDKVNSLYSTPLQARLQDKRQ